MRMTVSLCVIMVEITNNLKLLPLIMLVLLISKVWLLRFYFTCSGSRKYLIISDCRLLAMLLMKACMKNRHD